MRLIKLKFFYNGSKRDLKFKNVEEKCKSLKDLDNGMSNKGISEKYGVPRNTVSKWLRIKGKVLQDLKKSTTNPKRNKMRTGGDEDVDKIIF